MLIGSMCLWEKGCDIALAGLQKRQIAFTDYKDYIGMDITLAGHSTGVDHGALHHSTEGGRDHGVH